MLVKVGYLHNGATVMEDLPKFERYYQLADGLIEQSSKEELAQCARLLALNLAHYQTLHGEIPLDQTRAVFGGTEPDETQLKLLSYGMENLIGILGNVMSRVGEQKH